MRGFRPPLDSSFRFRFRFRQRPGPGLLTAFLACGLMSGISVRAEVVINEVVSSNGGSWKDETGATPDWIELRNTGTAAVALEGYGLSDRVDAPFKWVFPKRTLAAGAYLVVAASGEDRKTGTVFHTNFSLSRQGETVVLTPPAGSSAAATADSAPAVLLRRDMSLGRSPSDGSWRFFPKPTPGAANAGESFAEVLNEGPGFSAGSGFYDQPLSLNVSPPVPVGGQAAPEVRYTLDGSEPSKTSPLWNGPLSLGSRQGTADVLALIQGTSTVNQHTDGWKPPRGEGRKAWVVRARAFRDGALPSPVVSRTFFVGPDAKRTDGLAVISLMSAPDGLFNYQTGIYMLGKIFDDYVKAHPGEPLTGHTPANYTQRGAAWRRECAVDFFEPGAAASAWSAPAWLDIKGQSSRSFRQKTFGLDFTSTEPPENAVGYELFPGRRKMGDGSPLTVFQHLRLRNFGNDWAYASMRDGFCQQMAGGLGLDTSAWRPVSVFLDGEYWGILEMREEEDPVYFAAHYGVDPDEVAILNGDGSVEEGTAADTQAFVALRTYAETHDLSKPENLAWIEARMDWRNFLKYQAAEIYFGNADWPHNNVRLWRARRTLTAAEQAAALPGQDGRWRWLMFDLDLAVAHPWAGGYSENTLSYAISPTGRPGLNSPQSTSLLRALLKNPEVKAAFATQTADLLNSHFKASRATAMADTFKATLEPAMAEHQKRWQTLPDVTAWANQVKTVRTWASQREIYVRQDFTSTLSLGGYASLTVDRLPAGGSGGEVRVNSLTLNASLPGATAAVYPWTGTYFRQVPVTLTPLPAPGMEFEKWLTPAGDSAVPVLSLLLTGTTKITAQFRPAAPRWEQVRPGSGGGVSVVMSGQPGAVYQLQFSRNLVDWSDRETFLTNAAGRWEGLLPQPGESGSGVGGGGSSAGFYRARLKP